MKRPAFLALVASIPLLLAGTVFVTTRFTGLAVEAHRLEASQDEWVDQNAKLAASIAVLASRERIAAWAEKLGLEKAKPDRRIHIVPPSRPAAPTGSGPAQAGSNG